MAALIAIAVSEIKEDIRKGRVLASAESFSELHDYVDANEYGLLCSEAFDGWYPADDLGEDGVQAFADLGNAVQDGVDAIIKAGGLR